MFPSGVWRGFWEQQECGRQPMEAFELHFRGGLATGHGRDVVGRFTFHGEYDEKTGRVTLVKQYLGRHQVVYDGRPDGEGSILGQVDDQRVVRRAGVRDDGTVRAKPGPPAADRGRADHRDQEVNCRSPKRKRGSSG